MQSPLFFPHLFPLSLQVAAYEFTTLTCVPGVVKYKGAKLQMLDLPGIIEGAKDGKGRGRQIIAVARTCSCLLIVLDAAKPLTHKLIIERELDGFGIRLNKQAANISIKKREKGGISLSSTVKLTKVDPDTVVSVLKEYKVINVCDPLPKPPNNFSCNKFLKKKYRRTSASTRMQPLTSWWMSWKVPACTSLLCT